MEGYSFDDIPFDPKEVVVIKLERYEYLAAKEGLHDELKKEMIIIKDRVKEQEDEILDLNLQIEALNE